MTTGSAGGGPEGHDAARLGPAEAEQAASVPGVQGDGELVDGRGQFLALERHAHQVLGERQPPSRSRDPPEFPSPGLKPRPHPGLGDSRVAGGTVITQPAQGREALTTRRRTRGTEMRRPRDCRGLFAATRLRAGCWGTCVETAPVDPRVKHRPGPYYG